MKLQTKISLPLLALVLLLALSLSLVYNILLGALLEEEFQKRGASLATGLAASGRLGVLMQDSTQLSALVEASMVDQDIRSIAFLDEQGETIIAAGRRTGASPVGKTGRDAGDMQDSSSQEIKQFSAMVWARGEGSANVGRVALQLSLNSLKEGRRTSLLWSLGLGFAFSLLALVVVYFIMKILQPLKQLALQAETIAGGDLTVEVVHSSRDEVGQLAGAFKAMVQNLRTTLSQVSEAAEAVASASAQISSSTEEMAAGMQEQSSQTADVSAAVEGMSKTIVQNSYSANSTAEIGQKAKTAAEQGERVVEETVAGMLRIVDVVKQSAMTVRTLGKSSQQIGDIISVIDDIADQTNLLALNAAIEAARAGEQGRGFAVVADEVRKLAERTTNATKEIAGMIQQIQVDTAEAVKSIESGTTEVDRSIEFTTAARTSLRDIVDISQKVTEKITQIAVASEHQSSASEEISRNVEAISTVTRETAAGVQQIAKAADDLNRLTDRLHRSIGAFVLYADDARTSGLSAVTSTAPAPSTRAISGMPNKRKQELKPKVSQPEVVL